ncbi:MAG: hypothetical protein ACR2M9_04050 [Cyanophyceae cyanobacterium]
MSAFLKGSSFLVNQATGAMVVKDGYQMTGSNSGITFSNGTYQDTAAVTKKAVLTQQVNTGGNTATQINGVGSFNYVNPVSGVAPVPWTSGAIIGGEFGRNYIMTVDLTFGTGAPTIIALGETCVVELVFLLNVLDENGVNQQIGGYPGQGQQPVNGVKENGQFQYDTLIFLPANWTLSSYEAGVNVYSSNTTQNTNVINVSDITVSFYSG